MAERQTITEHLRQAASEAESLRALGREAGIDYAALYRFVHGQSDMRLSNADRLADALGIEVKRRKRKRKG